MLKSSWAVTWAATAIHWTTVSLNRLCDKLAAFATLWNQVLTFEHWATVFGQRQNGRSAGWTLLFTWFVVIVVDAHVLDWAGTVILLVT